MQCAEVAIRNTKAEVFFVFIVLSGLMCFLGLQTTRKGHVINSSIFARQLGWDKQFSMLRWWEGINGTVKLPPHLASFQPSLNLEEQSLMRKLFFKVTKLLQHNDIEYHLQSGTLIGAFRHHGIIPWDDDLDIYVHFKYNSTIEALFNQTKPVMLDNFELRYSFTQENNFAKIQLDYEWLNATHRIRHGRWPFMDIFMYREVGSNIKDYSWAHGTLSADRIFPLKLWPFEGSFQPVPRDIEYAVTTVCKDCFHILDRCCSAQKHQHVIEGLKATCVPCSELYPYFPFVRKSMSGRNYMVINTTLLGDV